MGQAAFAQSKSRTTRLQTGLSYQNRLFPFSFVPASHSSAPPALRFVLVKITGTATAFLILGVGRTGPSERLERAAAAAAMVALASLSSLCPCGVARRRAASASSSAAVSISCCAVATPSSSGKGIFQLNVVYTRNCSLMSPFHFAKYLGSISATGYFHFLNRIFWLQCDIGIQTLPM